MTTLLKIILAVDALILFPAILLQAGQGGGLTAQFGGTSSTDSFVGGRQATTLLHKATWWAGGVFLFLSFVLSLASARAGAPSSLVEQELRRRQQMEAPAPLQQLPLGEPAPLPGDQPATPPPRQP